MEEKKKGNGGLIVVIVLLVLTTLGLGGFIVYDKVLNPGNKCIPLDVDKKLNKETKKEENKDIETANEKNNTIETRSCIGTYSGQGAVTQDARTGQKANGTITIDLKEDGTYKLTKSGMDQYWIGQYTIIENVLLLKDGPSTCGPGADCSAKYSSFLYISDDCSKIDGGYGSVFFDSNFTLNKQ